MKLTNFLILICIILFALGERENLAFSGNAFFNGEYYTIITGLFVHANFTHLAGNMLFLFIFGNSLENEVGAVKTGLVFFSGGMLSFLLSIPFYPDANMIGASAAIFSVMAALLLVRKPEYSFQFLSPIGPLSLLYFIFNVIALRTGQTGNVAYISHIIGFAVGLFFGASWNKRWKESLLLTILLLAVYVILYNVMKVWI